jgi:competence protein ComEC
VAMGCVLAAMVATAFILCEQQEHQYDKVLGQLESDSEVHVMGTVYQKEIKTDGYLYYLKQSSNITEHETYQTGRILVYADTDEIPVGAVIDAQGTARTFETAKNEGNFDSAAYYRLQNITFRVFADSVSAVKKPNILFRERLYQLQKRVSQVFVEELSERDAGILCALTLGSKANLEEETKQMYQSAGISHILAISGLHISVLGYSIYRVLRKWKASYPVSALMSGGIVFAFAMMSGFGVSARRAVIMYFFLMGAQVFGRKYDPANALAASALVILIQNPLALFQSGFLFSFTALLSILLSAPMFDTKRQQESGRIKHLGEAFKAQFLVSLSIQIWMMPLTAWCYYEVPIYALFLNLLVLPLCSWLLGFGIFGGITGLFCPPLSKWLLVVSHLILDLYEKAMDVVARFPGSSLITGQPPVWRMVLYYGVLTGIAVFVLWKRAYLDRSKICKKQSNDEKKVGISRKMIACAKRTFVFVAVLCLLAIGLFLPQKQYARIDFLDVGQGDGICISDGAGRHIMIDGGSSSESQVGEYRILPFLKYHQIRRVDAWIVTHGDEDHISGLLEILEDGYPVNCLILADAMPRDEKWDALVSAAKENGTNVVYVSAGDALNLSNATMECLYPSEEDTSDDSNALSQVWSLQMNGLSVLFTGDLGVDEEQLLLERKLLGNYTVLKAGHHGSKNSSGEEFLKKVRPNLTIISCAEHNLYGHPHAETLQRMNTVGSEIAMTWEQGQILLRQENGVWKVRYPCAK